jgi:hypothetical protein
MTGGNQQSVATSDYREGYHEPLKLPQPSTGESDHVNITMGLAYNVYLSSSKVYGCKKCKTHLSNHDDILSRVSLPRSLGT